MADNYTNIQNPNDWEYGLLDCENQPLGSDLCPSGNCVELFNQCVDKDQPNWSSSTYEGGGKISIDCMAPCTNALDSGGDDGGGQYQGCGNPEIRYTYQVFANNLMIGRTWEEVAPQNAWNQINKDYLKYVRINNCGFRGRISPFKFHPIRWFEIENSIANYHIGTDDLCYTPGVANCAGLDNQLRALFVESLTETPYQSSKMADHLWLFEINNDPNAAIYHDYTWPSNPPELGEDYYAYLPDSLYTQEEYELSGEIDETPLLYRKAYNIAVKHKAIFKINNTKVSSMAGFIQDDALGYDGYNNQTNPLPGVIDFSNNEIEEDIGGLLNSFPLQSWSYPNIPPQTNGYFNLNFSNNNITGNLSDVDWNTHTLFSEDGGLYTLNLDNNQISGTIPQSFADWSCEHRNSSLGPTGYEFLQWNFNNNNICPPYPNMCFFTDYLSPPSETPLLINPWEWVGNNNNINVPIIEANSQTCPYDWLYDCTSQTETIQEDCEGTIIPISGWPTEGEGAGYNGDYCYFSDSDNNEIWDIGTPWAINVCGVCSSNQGNDCIDTDEDGICDCVDLCKRYVCHEDMPISDDNILVDASTGLKYIEGSLWNTSYSTLEECEASGCVECKDRNGQIDECGICGGRNNTVNHPINNSIISLPGENAYGTIWGPQTDCNGICWGPLYNEDTRGFDECYVCNGDNTSCIDNCGIFKGETEYSQLCLDFFDWPEQHRLFKAAHDPAYWQIAVFFAYFTTFSCPDGNYTSCECIVDGYDQTGNIDFLNMLCDPTPGAEAMDAWNLSEQPPFYKLCPHYCQENSDYNVCDITNLQNVGDINLNENYCSCDFEVEDECGECGGTSYNWDDDLGQYENGNCHRCIAENNFLTRDRCGECGGDGICDDYDNPYYGDPSGHTCDTCEDINLYTCPNGTTNAGMCVSNIDDCNPTPPEIPNIDITGCFDNQNACNQQECLTGFNCTHDDSYCVIPPTNYECINDTIQCINDSDNDGICDEDDDCDGDLNDCSEFNYPDVYVCGNTNQCPGYDLPEDVPGTCTVLEDGGIEHNYCNDGYFCFVTFTGETHNGTCISENNVGCTDPNSPTYNPTATVMCRDDLEYMSWYEGCLDGQSGYACCCEPAFETDPILEFNTCECTINAMDNQCYPSVNNCARGYEPYCRFGGSGGEGEIPDEFGVDNDVCTYEDGSLIFPGDVNHDSLVNVQDIVVIVGHILGDTPLNDPCKIAAADFNNDGTIDVLDIIPIMDLVLSETFALSGDSPNAKEYSLLENLNKTLIDVSKNKLNKRDLNKPYKELLDFTKKTNREDYGIIFSVKDIDSKDNKNELINTYKERNKIVHDRDRRCMCNCIPSRRCDPSAYRFFESFDLNDDGRITIDDYYYLIRNYNCPEIMHRWFWRSLVGMGWLLNAYPIPGTDVSVPNPPDCNNPCYSTHCPNICDCPYVDCDQGGDLIVEGCMDFNACNFNPDVTVDNGSCYYSTDYCDCDGNWNAETGSLTYCDCNGNPLGLYCDCDGTQPKAYCYDADGDGLGGCSETELTCPRIECIDPGYPWVDNCEDDCDDPNGFDCTGTCGGTAELDECGICDGTGIPSGSGCSHIEYYSASDDTWIEDNTIHNCSSVFGEGQEQGGYFDRRVVCNDGTIYILYEYDQQFPSGNNVSGDSLCDMIACDCSGNVLDECGICGGYGTTQIVCYQEPELENLIILSVCPGITCEESGNYYSGNENTVGCMDNTACNYDDSYTHDCSGVEDGDDISCCEYATSYCDCFGNPLEGNTGCDCLGNTLGNYCDCSATPPGIYCYDNDGDGYGGCGNLPEDYEGDCPIIDCTAPDYPWVNNCDDSDDACPAGNDYDCAGVCGGSSEIDDCGICGGSGATIECCDGDMVCDSSLCTHQLDYYGNCCAPDAEYITCWNGITVCDGGTSCPEDLTCTDDYECALSTNVCDGQDGVGSNCCVQSCCDGTDDSCYATADYCNSGQNTCCPGTSNACYGDYVVDCSAEGCYDLSDSLEFDTLDEVCAHIYDGYITCPTHCVVDTEIGLSDGTIDDTLKTSSECDAVGGTWYGDPTTPNTPSHCGDGHDDGSWSNGYQTCIQYYTGGGTNCLSNFCPIDCPTDCPPDYSGYYTEPQCQQFCTNIYDGDFLFLEYFYGDDLTGWNSISGDQGFSDNTTDWTGLDNWLMGTDGLGRADLDIKLDSVKSHFITNTCTSGWCQDSNQGYNLIPEISYPDITILGGMVNNTVSYPMEEAFVGCNFFDVLNASTTGSFTSGDQIYYTGADGDYIAQYSGGSWSIGPQPFTNGSVGRGFGFILKTTNVITINWTYEGVTCG